MDRKPLKIGDLTARIPVIQGGMGVGISLSHLAGSVAANGGVGILSAAQIGFREPDFEEHPKEANLRAIQSQLAKARGYAQNWDEFKKAGIGLLLFGNVGTGKSYAAGCIANALIDRLESVLFVGMSDVVNRMQGNFGADRDHYMKSLMRPDLLILDDLGAERNTSFGKERVFDVVDKRLLTGKPMIVTTNIPLSVMKQAADLDDRRIFDRILEVCVPIMFDGDSFRKSTAADNLKTAARLLG